jgi:hypothetical protein
MSDSWKLDEHWKVINSGSIVVSSTPQQLWEQAVDYFKWMDANPIITKRTHITGKTQGQKYEVEFKRPYSIESMCLHCGISKRWIEDIRQTHDKSSEYYIVLERILMVIYTQVLEGAVVDLYNPIMASKMLNLDKQNDDDNKTVRVEIIDTGKVGLPNSESQILEKLDSEKVNIVKDKSENPTEHDSHAH